MSNEVLAFVQEATLAGSAAIAVVLLLRKPLRALFGAGAAYAAWGLVPAALVAILLPAAAVSLAPTLMPPILAGVDALPGTPQLARFDAEPWLLGLWTFGVVVAAIRLVQQQRRFLRGLGPLRPRTDGLFECDGSEGLPAVIGWRPRIVVPVHFDRHYDATERELVLCHERVHLRRGDLYVGALASGLRCLFWFNPLVHLGAGRFRNDQELACDAAVLRRHPRSRRAYGDALLKTQLAGQPLPFGCHWFGSHPLKERIAMLKRPLPSKSRWFTGLVLVAVLTVAGGWTAWAAQPERAATAPAPAQGELALTMKVIIDGESERVDSLNMRAGQPRTFDYEPHGQAWRIVLTLTPLDDGTIYADADISRDGVSQGKPKMTFKAAGGWAIGIGESPPGGGFKGIAIELDVALPSEDAVLPAGKSEPLELTEGVAGQPPKYPAGSVAAGEGGTVMLKVLVGIDGRVLRSEFVPEKSTVKAGSALVASSIEAAAQWTFKPAIEAGKPVEGWVLVPVTFDPTISSADPVPR